ncbi:RDD family protein [Cellulomonas telluris]|uniref:RDD family protein n=1 Tax=Cellulomonas telluris TaxID=2306636 RepID=UPI0014562905|nr:RDD family protein [Cellulomonas telluris]
MATTAGLDASTELPAAGVPWIAPWWRRVLAAVLDGWLVGTVTFLLGAPPMFGPAALVPANAVDVTGTATWPVGLAALAVLLALQGWTGATPGKRVLGIAVVRRTDGRPTGFVPAVGRAVLHLLDAVLLLGYLRPLWHPRGWTFADGLAGTEVVQTRVVARAALVERVVGPRRPGPASAAVTTAAVVACALGGAFALPTTTGAGVGTSACATEVEGDPSVAAPGALVDAEVRWTGGFLHETRLGVRRTYRADDAAVAVQWRLADVPDGAVRLGLEVSPRPGGAPRVVTVDLHDGAPQRVETPHGTFATDGTLTGEGALLGSAHGVVSSLGDGYAVDLPPELLDGFDPVTWDGGDAPWRWVAWAEVEGVRGPSCTGLLH